MKQSFVEPIARPLAAVLYRSERDLSPLEASLIGILGPIKARTTPSSFSHSNYYAAEMGPDLLKYYLVFDTLMRPMDIVPIKHQTSQLEHKFAHGQRETLTRTYNIDPGYFTHAQLVLATHKNYAHRISLGAGVYAELTYLIQGREWQSFPWTYPDYNQPEVRGFFIEQRNQFVKETKGQRPAPGARIPMWQLMEPEPMN